ncbi:hypothetical protein C8Q74DRAFT_1244179 [Fomes fomentarius]|nr:hypothetical protein C8Q74DRAFT_1244179 [Fomes fomentarius]
MRNHGNLYPREEAESDFLKAGGGRRHDSVIKLKVLSGNSHLKIPLSCYWGSLCSVHNSISTGSPAMLLARSAPYSR